MRKKIISVLLIWFCLCAAACAAKQGGPADKGWEDRDDLSNVAGAAGVVRQAGNWMRTA